ncbi:MAG: hypothetical protein Q9209_002355 [Squamulea sp. 1 TL-2023]
MSAPGAIEGSSLDSQYDALVNLIHRKLPPELVNQIEETVYEMVFCPGYVYIDVSGFQNALIVFHMLDKLARPELLCLSKDLHRRYSVRLWTENICIIKTESQKYLEIIPVRGHLDDPLNFLFSIGEREEHIKSLHQYMIDQEQICQYSLLLSQDSPPKPLEKIHKTSAKALVKYLYSVGEKCHCGNGLYKKAIFRFADTYGGLGEWLGLGMEPLTDHDRGTAKSRSQPPQRIQIMWKVVSLITGRTKECHERLQPEMANQIRQVDVELIQIRNRIYIFT